MLVGLTDWIGPGGGGGNRGGKSGPASGAKDSNLIDDMMAGPDSMQSQKAMMAAAAAEIDVRPQGVVTLVFTLVNPFYYRKTLLSKILVQ
jgi:hypothetical protein